MSCVLGHRVHRLQLVLQPLVGLLGRALVGVAFPQPLHARVVHGADLGDAAGVVVGEHEASFGEVGVALLRDLERVVEAVGELAREELGHLLGRGEVEPLVGVVRVGRPAVHRVESDLHALEPDVLLALVVRVVGADDLHAELGRELLRCPRG